MNLLQADINLKTLLNNKTHRNDGFMFFILERDILRKTPEFLESQHPFPLK